MPGFARPRMVAVAPLACALVLVCTGASPDRELPPPGMPTDLSAMAGEVMPYPHKRVLAREFGAGEKSYWLFEPDDPMPERAPVVVLNHGWLAVNPGAYGAWIEHLVRQG
ncbi:MAG TPA: hypothetical protein VGY53_08080, partial [Isosphaeraceae bacterium]|nr:hypothetical protein [Isosphaeraceae bacterium]